MTGSEAAVGWLILRSGFEIVDAEHSDDGIFAGYVLRAC